MVNACYFDNSTVTPPSKEAVSAALRFMGEEFGLPAQLHQKGAALNGAMNAAYTHLYQLAKAADADQFFFTASSAEAINGAFLSTYLHVSQTLGKNHFIAFQCDEAASLLSLHRLEELGAAATVLKPAKNGLIDLTALQEAMTPRTCLLSISLVNGLTGVIQPLDEIAKLCHQRGVLLLVDATHALGKIPMDFANLPIDFMSFSGEQIHALQGTGGLFLKGGLRFQPIVLGAVANVAGLISLGVAAKEAMAAEDYFGGEVARLKFLLESEIVKAIPEAKIAFSDSPRAPHITAILFPGIVNETLAFLLDREGVFVSFGGGTRQHISYLLESCGYSFEEAASALSFSLSRETTEAQIERGVQKLASSYYKLLKGSAAL